MRCDSRSFWFYNKSWGFQQIGLRPQKTRPFGFKSRQTRKTMLRYLRFVIFVDTSQSSLKTRKSLVKRGFFVLFAPNIFFVGALWCGKRDLNPYGVNHTPLKRARLPVPPLPRGCAHAQYILYSFFLKCQALFRKNFVYTEKSFRLPLQIPRFIGIIFLYNALGRWDFVSHTFFCC